MPSMSHGGHSCCIEAIARWARPTRSRTRPPKGVLVYTTEPLERDVVLLGDAGVDLYASSTAIDTDFTARLCVVDASGRFDQPEGGHHPRTLSATPAAEPRCSSPARCTAIAIPSARSACRLQAGQRIRLDVSSSEFPQWDRNLNTGGPLGREPASRGRRDAGGVPQHRSAVAPAAARRKELLVIFDSHMHVGSFESMFGVSLDRDGIARADARSTRSRTASSSTPTTRTCAEVVESIPGLYGLVWANPRRARLPRGGASVPRPSQVPRA